MAKEIQRLTTPPFICSFPNAFKAKPGGKNGDGTPKYGVTAIWDKSTFSATDKKRWEALLKALDEESRRAFKKAWKDLNPLVYRRGLRKNGDRENPFEGFEDSAIFANITSLSKPGVIDINKDEISPEEGNEDLLYPGCLCRATVNVYSFENEGKGVGIGLFNIQVISSDEDKYPRLDNRTKAEDDFDDDLDAAWLDGDEESVDGDDEGEDY